MARLAVNYDSVNFEVPRFVEGWWANGGGDAGGGGRVQIDTVDGIRLNRRSIRDVNKKHHVHMSNERVPAAVPRWFGLNRIHMCNKRTNLSFA
jgi:hypothetical protein